MSEETLKQRIIKNTVWNFICTSTSRVGGLIFTIIIARVLFPELFGVYALALTIILTISTFTDLGLNSTITRYLAESLKIKSKKKEIEARSRLSFLFNFKVLLTAVISFALFFLAETISIYIFKKPTLVLPLKIGAVYLFAISLQGFLSAIFVTLQKIKYNAISEFIFEFFRIGLVVVFLYAYKTAGAQKVGNVFIALAISLFISCIFLFIFLLKKYKFLISGEKFELEKKEKVKLLSFFGWLSISSISLIFFINIDTFMLGIFLPQAEFVGFYQAIFSIVGAVVAFVAFSGIFLPIFTQMKKENIEKNFKKIFHYLSIITIPAAIGLAFIIVPAMRLIYGPAYVPAQYGLAIFLAAVLTSLFVIESAFTALYSTIFQAREKPKIPALLVVLAAIENIILNYFFIKIGISIAPQYALVGAAAATLISRYTNLILLGVSSRKNFNLKASASSITKPLLASAIMLAFLILFKHFVAMNIFTAIIMIILAAIIYFVFITLFKGIKKEELRNLKYI